MEWWRYEETDHYRRRAGQGHRMTSTRQQDSLGEHSNHTYTDTNTNERIIHAENPYWCTLFHLLCWDTQMKSFIVDFQKGLWTELSSAKTCCFKLLLVKVTDWPHCQNSSPFLCSLSSQPHSPRGCLSPSSLLLDSSRPTAAESSSSKPTELLPTAEMHGYASIPAQLTPAKLASELNNPRNTMAS